MVSFSPFLNYSKPLNFSTSLLSTASILSGSFQACTLISFSSCHQKMDEWKRSGQIPAFGNWDFANELPITQYFECARQAGLVRYSSSSGESDPYTNVRADRDLYAVDVKKQNKKGMSGNREMRCSYHNVNKVMRKPQGNGNGKVCDVTEQPRKQQIRSKQLFQHDVVPRSAPHNLKPKPVDEDLYKIPPELLRTTKRKKMLGFISKCLVPAACVS